MATGYNVYFSGQVLAGEEPAEVRRRLGQLFKADEATLDKLFSGKAQLVKRNCDKATALKYKQAMEQAGAAPLIKAIAAEPAAAEQAPAAKLTAAQRIAMLANAPDVGRPDADRQTAENRVQAATTGDTQRGTFGILPAGSDVLRPEERQGPASPAVTAPDLEVGAGGERLSAVPPAAPPAPDTSHPSAAPVGATLPTLPATAEPVSPDTSALHLAPEGTDFSDCAAVPPAAPNLDLAGIELAPPGADVLEARYRARHDQPPPSTGHLALDG